MYCYIDNRTAIPGRYIDPLACFRYALLAVAIPIVILVIFIVAYGVASQALRYPNSEPSWSLLKDVVYKPYWQMYGELFLEELEGRTILTYL